MTNVVYYDTIQDLINTTTTPDVNTKVVVLGYHEISDNGGGTFYWDPSSNEPNDGGTIFSVNGISVGRYKRIIGGDQIKATWFGAKADGVTDDSQALKDALLYVRDHRTNPTGWSGFGQNTLILDKGEYIVTETLTNIGASHLGFSIVGAGEYATQITFRNDIDPLFNFKAHINTTFKSFTIHHDIITEQSEEYSWSNSAFLMNGDSGGRRFTLENITIINFDTQIRQIEEDEGNNDTNLFIGCTFRNFNTFLYSRNSQAVVNEYLQCTWSGNGDVFDIAGYGHTQINGGNIVVAGTWFKFANIQGSYGPSSVINLNNVKGEYRANANGNVLTRIIDANGENIYCKMIFNNCGIGNKEEPDPSARTFVFGARRTEVTFNGGAYQKASIETIGNSFSTPIALKESINFIKFIDCDNTPDPINVFRNGDQDHPSITYIDCRNRTNITLLSKSTYVASPMHTNVITRSLGRLTGASGESQDELLFYGQETVIDEIMVAINATPNDTETKTVKVYQDSARTSLISTLTLQGNPEGIAGFFDNIKGRNFTEGLYFDMSNTAGQTFGKIVVRSYNI